MKVFISGPMTGYPKHNHDNFERAAIILRADGHEVFSPAELIPNGKVLSEEAGRLARELYLGVSVLCLLKSCDAIALLKCWGESGGAVAEAVLAVELGYSLFEFDAYAASFKPLSRKDALFTIFTYYANLESS